MTSLVKRYEAAVYEELKEVLDQEPVSIVHKLRQRISEGYFTGDFYQYIYKGRPCGCVYGSLAIENGMNTHDDVDDYIQQTYGFDPYDERLFWTDLELYVMSIQAGDTPQTNPRSAELIDMIDYYLEERSCGDRKRTS